MSGVFPGDFEERTSMSMVFHTMGALGSGTAFVVAGYWLRRFFRAATAWKWLSMPLLVLTTALVLTSLARIGSVPGLGPRSGLVFFFLWVGVVGRGPANAANERHRASRRSGELASPDHRLEGGSRGEPCTAALRRRQSIVRAAIPSVRLLAQRAPTVLLGLACGGHLKADDAKKAAPAEDGKRPLNVIFLICDQESYHLRAKGDFPLPARQALQKRGVTPTALASYNFCSTNTASPPPAK